MNAKGGKLGVEPKKEVWGTRAIFRDIWFAVCNCSSSHLPLIGKTSANSGSDGTRTRDLLRDRQLKTIYLVGPSSFMLRRSEHLAEELRLSA